MLLLSEIVKFHVMNNLLKVHVQLDIRVNVKQDFKSPLPQCLHLRVLR